jgi:hypothetical protein
VRDEAQMETPIPAVRQTPTPVHDSHGGDQRGPALLGALRDSTPMSLSGRQHEVPGVRRPPSL